MAVRFDAATDRVSYTASAPPDPQSGFTFICWAYLSVDQNTNSTIIRIHASSGTVTRFNLATGTDGTTPAVFTPGNTGGVTGTDVFTVGAWLKLAVTQTGTTATIWTATPAGTTHSVSGTSSGGSVPDGVTLGGRAPSDATEWFNGRLRRARYYSAVLTQAEIEAEWASPTAVRTSGLWAHWALPSAADLTDSSGNARNLVAGSTAVTTEDDPPFAFPPKAAGTGAANQPTVSTATGGTSAPAGNAAGTGAAGAATAKVSPAAGAASGTGAAPAPAAKVALSAGAGTGTGTAQTAVAKVSPATGLAAATGSAGAPSITASSSVPAGNASGTGTASSATANIAPAPAVAAGTGSAGTPRAAVSPAAGAASGSGAAAAPTPNVASAAGQATGAGAAGTVSPAVSATTSTATGTGTALGATVTATGAGQAPAGLASATGTAPAPSVTVSAQAGAATGTGAAGTPAAGISPATATATGTGTARTATDAIAAATATATGSGTSSAAAAGVGPAAGVATATGAARTPATVIAAQAGAAAGTGTAGTPTASTSGSSIAVPAQRAAGSGSAYPATVQTASTTPATSSGWDGLLGMLREAADIRYTEESRDPAACPQCGGALTAGPAGDLVCQFDGTAWEAGGRQTFRTPTRRPDVQPIDDDRDPVSCLDCGEPLRAGPDGSLYCSFDGQIWDAGNRRVGLVGTTHN